MSRDRRHHSESVQSKEAPLRLVEGTGRASPEPIAASPAEPD